MVAEHVPRRDLQRRVLRPGGADDERLGRVGLRVVRDHHRLVARERADHDVRAELLHQPPRLAERGRGGVVAAAVPDDAHVLAARPDAGHARGGLLLVPRLAAGVLGEGGLGAADVQLVAERERALAVGHDRHPDDVRLRRGGERARDGDQADGEERGERKQQLPATQSLHLSSFGPTKGQRGCCRTVRCVQPPFTTSRAPGSRAG